MNRTRRAAFAARPPEWTRRTWRRGALLERLRRARDARIVLVRGPSGSGKTALLAQAHDALVAEGRTVCWIGLSDTDSARSAERLHAILARPRCTDLFVDGYEHIAGRSEEQSVRSLLEQESPVRIWIGTRVAPKLPVAAARTRRELLELGPRDLAFSATEIAAAAEGLLTEAYVRHLERQTDGVPVAVHLALRSIDSSEGEPSAPAWEEQLSAYYREQILASLGPDEQAFLRRMVIVDLFDVSLAEAIHGPCAGRFIEKLHREDGLLIRDRRSRLFHLPGGLRSCLAAELEWLDEATRSRLHTRAARWFEERELYAEAAMHALAAQDGARAGALIGRVGSVALNARFGLARIESSLSRLPPESISVDPALSDVQALVHCQHGSRALESPPARIAEGVPVARDRAINELFVLSYADRPPTAPMLARCVEIAEEFAAENLVTRGLARNLLCWHEIGSGRLSRALHWAELAVRDYVAANALYAAAHMHLHRATIFYWRRALEQAREECALAERVAKLFFPEDERLQSLAWIYRATVEAELGVCPSRPELASMLAYAHANEALTEALILVHRLAIRAAAGEGNAGAAEDVLARGLALASRRGNTRLSWALRVEHLWLLTQGRRLEEAESVARELALGSLDPQCPPAAVGWTELVEGIVCHARLEIVRGDADEARRSIATLRTLARRSELPRAEAMAIELENALGPRAGRRERAGREGRSEAPAESAVALTAREQELMRLLAEGLPNKQLAHRLKLSEATIKFHIRNIYRKLGAHNRVQAVARLRRSASQGESGPARGSAASGGADSHSGGGAPTSRARLLE